ncbi:MAG: serine/threonine-protein kinase [Hyalangium sp.]|uniref:serine/threonine-protein kinase n=1 Tax=Hyalangium sp. TaxID=2028555 RepID=UPI00389B0A78
MGPWVLEGYSGRGTYGAVYRARRAGHPGSLPVALKLALFCNDPRFMREVGLLSRIQHPAVPRLLDRGWWHADSERMHPYLVMEWIRGLTLYEWARVHQPSTRQVLRVAAQLMWGLEALHRAGGLHRDVKGDNILVEPEGRAVLTDFGSGTWVGAPPITDRLMAPGTPEYRSPEAVRFQWEHWREKDARYEARPTDDLYALGVSLYRLVTGRYPPPGTDPEPRAESLLPPLPSRRAARELNPRVMPDLSALIEWMLAREPEARGRAGELAEAAESVAEHAGSEADVPLFDPERPVSATLEAMPVRKVQVAVPAHAASVPVAVSARVRTGSLAHARRLWLGLAVAAVFLTVVCMAWEGHSRREEVPQFACMKVLSAGAASGGGTRGLGDNPLMRWEVSEKPPHELKAKAIAERMPDEPMEGQKHAPCKGTGEREINGACWRQLFDNPPNCGDDAYEWKHGCYYPVMEKKTRRPRTSSTRDSSPLQAERR